MQRRIIVFFLLTTLLASNAPAASAQALVDPNPDVSTWIEADLRLAHASLGSLALEGTLLLREVESGGEPYTASELREAYRGANRFGRATGDAFTGQLEASIESQVEGVLAASFPGADLSDIIATVDRATLTAADQNAYDPPVRVSVAAQVERSSEQLGLGDYADEAIAAAFLAGAQVDAAFSLSARPGYATTYSIVLPPGLHTITIEDADAPPGHAAATSSDGREVVARLDNVGGYATLTRGVLLTLADPAAQPATAEDVDREVEIRFGEIAEGADAVPVSATVRLDVRAVDVASRFRHALPPRVKLEFVDADSVRRLYQTGAITDATIAAGERSILASLSQNLTASFGSMVNVTGGFDRAQLAAAAGSGAPLTFTAEGHGARRLPGHAAGSVDLALDLGAAIGLEVALASGPGASTYTLHAPPGVAFEAAENGVLAEDGRSVTFATLPGDGRIQAAVVLRSTTAAVHHAQDASLGITVDLKDIDVSLGKAMSGDLGALVIDVDIVGDLRVLPVPESLTGALHDSVQLSFVSSDGLRLLRQRGILDDENLTRFEAQALDQIRSGLEGALGQPVAVAGGFDLASLEADVGAVGEPLQPIVFRASASLRQPLSGAAASDAQAAVALYTTTQSFTLPRVQGLETSYTFILPKGLALTRLDAPGGTSETGTSADGRDQFTVTPEGERAEASVSMAVTPTFVVAKFWPALLLAAVVLMVLVGTPVAFLLRSRRA